MANYTRELVAEAVVRGFQGVEVFTGSGVFIVRNDLPLDSRSAALAKTISIPYFGVFGSFEDLPLTGGALTPRTIGSDAEVATVKRSGAAFFTEIFDRMSAAEDPYAVMEQQVRDALKLKIADTMMALASTPVAGDANLTTVYSSVTPAYYDLRVDNLARGKWGDEMDFGEGPALRFMHSTVWQDVLALTDSTGRPLATETVNGSDTVRMFNGVRTVVSDRLPVDTTVRGTVLLPEYTTYLFKRGAGIFWSTPPMNGSDRDILAWADINATHFFYAGHMYRHPNGRTKAGWQIIRSNGNRPLV